MTYQENELLGYKNMDKKLHKQTILSSALGEHSEDKTATV